MMPKCDFCMYRDGCLGPLPGDHLGCLAFCVAKEDASAYEDYLAEEARKKDEQRQRFCESLREV